MSKRTVVLLVVAAVAAGAGLSWRLGLIAPTVQVQVAEGTYDHATQSGDLRVELGNSSPLRVRVLESRLVGPSRQYADELHQGAWTLDGSGHGEVAFTLSDGCPNREWELWVWVDPLVGPTRKIVLDEPAIAICSR